MASRQILGHLLILFFILFSQRVTVLCEDEEVEEQEGTVSPKIDEREKDKEITAREGEQVKLECAIQEKGQLPVIWKKGNTMIFIGGFYAEDAVHKKYFILDRDNNFVILHANRSSSGIYSCSVTAENKEISQNHHLNVLYAPTWVKIKPENLSVKKTDKVQLQCESDGYPVTSKKWKFNNEKALPVSMKVHGNNLTIVSASQKDIGDITCIASNAIGSSQKTIRLNVKYGPELNNPKAETIEVPAGKDASLSCEHDANPDANIVWKLNGTEVKGKDNMMTLDLKNLQLSQGGTYECHLSNEEAKVIKQFQLKISSQADEAHSTMNYQQTEEEGSSVGGQAAISVKEEQGEVSTKGRNSSSLPKSSLILPLFIIFLIICIL